VAAALVAAADFLFWGSDLGGLNFFLFYVAIAAGILIVRGAVPLTLPVLSATALAVLGALPLLEAPSLWGWLSATFGAGMLALAAVSELPRQLVDLPGVLVRFGIMAPGRFIADSLTTLIHAAERGLGKAIVRNVLMWVVPLILAVVFLGLFSMANPLIENALLAFNLDAVARLFDPWRVIVWGVVLCFVWPLLLPKLLGWQAVAEMQGPHLPRPESVVFGRGAILRSLVLFNLLFAVQTVLDVAYLWGGITLPDGMTYANYAHRGAYPLIVTALLAAAFVLAAMRGNGPGEHSPVIRALVYAFIWQDVMLVVSSILRLDLYVESYMLTELRVAAGIWMGLVAVGLLLIMARIALRKSNKWLIATNLLSLGLVLYACAYVDEEALISRFNVDHSRELTGEGVNLDIAYFGWELGRGSIPALDRFVAEGEAKGVSEGVLREARLARNEMAANFTHRIDDWRRWSFRDWRLGQYLTGAGDFAIVPPVARTDGTATMPEAPRPDTATMP
jgi:hypothetical protein